jgi:hypothetical protein
LWSWHRAHPTVNPRNGRADRVGPVHHVLDAVFLVDGAVLRRALADPEEGRRQRLLLFLRRRLARQQVARQLPGAELIERHVAVECRNHPVAIRPEQPIVVVVEEAVAL